MKPAPQDIKVEPNRVWLQFSVVASLLSLAVSVGWFGGGAATQLKQLHALVVEQAKATKEQNTEIRAIQRELSAVGARLVRVEHALDKH